MTTSLSGSWHTSDAIARLLHNETSTGPSETTTETTATISSMAATNSSGSPVTVSAAIDILPNDSHLYQRSGRTDPVATAYDSMTTMWPPSDGDFDFEFNRTGDVGMLEAGANQQTEVKLRYDTGSNFMLLLEDFGEYFYSGANGSDTSSSAAAVAAAAAADVVADSNGTIVSLLDYPVNCTLMQLTNGTACVPTDETEYSYWALILLLFPILTLFGNVLVILSVYRERALQTVTNYFIVSLALADLLVAVVVMPFAVYVLVNNGRWSLPEIVCDYYIAMDVICSTSSIFNLVAISIDRYIAVTQPIKYARHRNSKRVSITILLVWAISVAIGSPIVLGLNSTPTRAPDLCMFYNSDFIIFSSLSSFYIPCIIMVFLYWNIFKALRTRAAKQRAARKPHLAELVTGGAGSVIENIAAQQSRQKLAETTLDGSGSGSKSGSRIMADDAPTNTASGSNEDDEEVANAMAASPDGDGCHVIVNDKSTEYMLATVVEEAGNVVAQITSPSSGHLHMHLHHHHHQHQHHHPHHHHPLADPNGNHDSGYAPSTVEDTQLGSSGTPDPMDQQTSTATTATTTTTSSSTCSPRHIKAIAATKSAPMGLTTMTTTTVAESVVSDMARMTGVGSNATGIGPVPATGTVVVAVTKTSGVSSVQQCSRKSRNGGVEGAGSNGAGDSPKQEPLSVALKPLSLVRYGVQEALALARHDSTISTNSRGSTKEKKNAQASRFTIYKVHKASKKKREKSSAKKERKATKTLAIVLGVFLVCWVPFFTCNMLDALCTKLGNPNCNPSVTTFIFTTWLGYMNSFVNPVIYTIFNPEFRKAFKKIMHIK